MNLVNIAKQQGANMSSNYTALTRHGPPKVKQKPYKVVPMVPNLGEVIDFDPSLVSQAEYEEGKLGTPMTKVRKAGGDTWKQIAAHEAGLLVFLTGEPTSAHTKMTITSIIPSKTACYAELE